jgi:hypothetical protein
LIPFRVLSIAWKACRTDRAWAEGPLEARGVLAVTPSLRAVVADEDLANAGEGVELLERIRAGYHRVRRVLLT